MSLLHTNLLLKDSLQKKTLASSSRICVTLCVTLLLTGLLLTITTQWTQSLSTLNNFYIEDESDSVSSSRSGKRRYREFQDETSSDEGIFKQAAVAAESQICSTLGSDILKAGGNAVDSAIGTALCVGSINSFSAGIGGGGFMIIRTPSGKTEILDFREAASHNVKPEMYDKNPKQTLRGGMAVAVPGEIRGFEAAHARYGRMSWNEIFSRAAQLNEDGFIVTEVLAQKLQQNSEWIMKDRLWSSVFSRNGKVLVAGDKIVRKRYASALRKIADGGSKVFYDGEIGDSIVKAVKDGGGVLDKKDLAKYQPIWRKPVVTNYHGLKIFTAPPPASGAALSHILNILNHAELKNNKRSTLSYHRIIEAFRFGYAKRSLIADPKFIGMNGLVEELQSTEAAANAWFKMSNKHTLDPSKYGAQFDAVANHGTTHVSVIDKFGMAVGVTTTINDFFGSRVMDSDFNIPLNNQMDDFSVPGTVNHFNLPASPINYIAPGKRPVSSAAPTIVVLNGKVDMVLGASGGSRIITAVASVLINYYDFGMPLKEAIYAPRLHNQLMPNECVVEYNFPKRIIKRLKNKGHKFRVTEEGLIGDVVQAVAKNKDGSLTAVSDFRKGGVADGY